MFKVGDHIVYPMYGAGIITDIEEKDFLGEICTYYSVSLPYSRMEASVPVDNCEELGVRAIIDQSRIDEVIEVLKGDTEPMNPNWNKRYRENTERMQTGDILEVLLEEGEPLDNVPRNAKEQGYNVLSVEHVEGTTHKVTIQK